jgi:hypothetical protein
VVRVNRAAAAYELRMAALDRLLADVEEERGPHRRGNGHRGAAAAGAGPRAPLTIASTINRQTAIEDLFRPLIGDEQSHIRREPAGHVAGSRCRDQVVDVVACCLAEQHRNLSAAMQDVPVDALPLRHRDIVTRRPRPAPPPRGRRLANRTERAQARRHKLGRVSRIFAGGSGRPGPCSLGMT